MPLNSLIEQDIEDRVRRSIKSLDLDEHRLPFIVREIPEDPTSASPPPRGIRLEFAVDNDIHRIKFVDVPFGPDLDAKILDAVRSTQQPK